MADQQPGDTRGESLALAAITALALGTRALQVALSDVMFNDGPRFLAMAEAFGRGDWRAALSDSFHPLMSLAMAGLSGALPLSLESSAHWIGIAAGGLATWAIYGLARAGFGRSIATGAALLVALHPRLVATAIGPQSDGLYLACFLLAARAAQSALSGAGVRAALAAGASCALAYLARPEGLSVAVVFGGALAWGSLRGALHPTAAAARGAAFALALFLVAAPYVLALRAETGVWTLTQKKRVIALLSGAEQRVENRAPAEPPPGAEPAPPPEPDPRAPPTPREPQSERFGRELRGLGVAAVDGYRAFQPVVFALLLLGIRRGRPEPVTAHLLAYAAVFAAALVLLQLSAGYVSRRHWLSVVALGTPFAARGAIGLWRGARQRWPALAAPRVAPAAVALLALGFLISGLPDVNPAKRARREAAEWLGAEHAPSAVAVHRSRLAHYAGAATWVSTEAAPDLATARERALAQGARHAVLDLAELPAEPGEIERLSRELHRITYRGGAVVVLEFLPAPGPPGSAVSSAPGSEP